MNKRHLTGINILFLLVFLLSLSVSGYDHAWSTTYAESAEKGNVISVKGKVKGFSDPRQSKTISVDVKKKGILIFKYNNATTFKNFKTLPELTNEAVVVEYRTVGPDNVATSITKALVKLPSGVTEIKTAEVAALVEKGPVAGNYFLADARPAKRYAEGYIPGAVSVPVTKLEKEGQKLLPADKDIPLIFYCGGPT
jgi:hypothetical protein